MAEAFHGVHEMYVREKVDMRWAAYLVARAAEVCKLWDGCKSNMEVFKPYQLLKKMYQYPALLGMMRSMFMEVMEQKGIITKEELQQQILEEMKANGVPDTESNRQEYKEALIDLHFSKHFSPAEI